MRTPGTQTPKSYQIGRAFLVVEPRKVVFSSFNLLEVEIEDII